MTQKEVPPVSACPYLKDKSRWHCDIHYVDPQTGKLERVRRVAPKDKKELEAALKWGENERLRIVTDLAVKKESEPKPEIPKKKASPTLAEIWPEFESDYLAEQTYSTRNNYDAAWRLHLASVKSLTLENIDESTLKGLKGDLKKKNLKITSIKKILEGLCAALKWCLGTKLPRDHKVPKLKWPRREESNLETYSKDQIESFIAAANRHRDRTLALLLTDGALRIGEPAGLKWDDIDLEAGSFWVRRNVSKRRLQERTKGGKAACLPMSHRLREALRILREQSGDSSWIFPSKSGGNTTDRALGQIVRRLMRRAGIPVLGPHRIRHSVLTIAALGGATPYSLQKWARHASMKTTMTYYVHLDGEIAAAAISCIAGPTPVPTPTVETTPVETTRKQRKRPPKKAA